jgi:peptidase M28-like protein
MSIRYLIVVLVLLGCATSYKINEKEVERVLKTLSSDEMLGRKINSSGIDKAADFIAREFKAIGLGEVNDAVDFKQNFNVKSTSVVDSKLNINDVTFTKLNFFIQLSQQSIVWDEKDSLEIIYVKKGDNFRQSVGGAFRRKENQLIIISPSHTATFKQYYSYLTQPKISFGIEESSGGNMVFVLTDIEKVEKINVGAKLSVSDRQLTNVVGIIPGERLNEMVLYSAHYDHLGIGPAVKGDSIFNGANDDASGVTAVIELARFFKSKGIPERTLVFAAFTAEEVGGYGSKYFSKQVNPDEIVAMINIEMIGKPSKEGLNSAWMSGWHKSDLGLILQESLQKINFKFFADPYPEQQLFYRSDNATLARLGVPAHSISTTQIDIDTDYHQLSDEIETLDITNITNTINAIAIGSKGIVDGLQTPSRVDPEQVDH